MCPDPPQRPVTPPPSENPLIVSNIFNVPVQRSRSSLLELVLEKALNSSASENMMNSAEGNTSNDSIEAGPASPKQIAATPRVNNNTINIRETPLSTKREMVARVTPRCQKLAPRQAKTAPIMKTINPIHIRDPSPKLITKCGVLLPMSSPHYNPRIRKTYFEQTFHFEELLGRGSYGEVFSAHSYDDSVEYAVKVSIALLRPNCSKKYREVQNHMKANGHPNIVRLMKAWEEAGRLYIQTERCDWSLLHYCSKKHVLDEAELWKIFVDVVSAVHHLHQMDLIHDDIKPENIFLTKEFISKLGDFGLCIDLNNPHEVKTAEEGDSKYLAGEVLNGVPTKASDVFSLGMTLLEAATDMALPSSGEAWHQIREGNIPERFFIGINPDMKRLILAMIQLKPELRPTTSELLQDPAVKNRVLKRRIYLELCATIEILTRWCFVLLTWCMALCSVVFHYPIKLLQLIADRRSAIAAQMSNQPATQQHTPIQTPETSKAFAESLIVPSPFDFSDDENSSNHFQRRLFPSAAAAIKPIRLIFDDDDDDDEEQATSSSNSSAIDDPSASPVRIRQDYRSGTPKSARQIFQNHKGAGDFGEHDVHAEKSAKYMRMMNVERRRDLDDNLNQVNDAPIPTSCPPMMLRHAARPVKVSALNFNLLDDEEPKKKKNPIVDSPARPSVRPRRGAAPRVLPLRARLMSFQSSSGDEI